MQRVFFNFLLAMEAVMANRLRAFLTGMGIFFGVAAVIAMLAIGTGAKQSILDRMKLIGTNNIVIKAVIPEDNDQAKAQTASNTSGSGGNNNNGKDSNKKPWSPGLTVADMEAIQTILPQVEQISPEIVLPTSLIEDGKLEKGRCIGITNAFFELNNLSLDQGKFFHAEHLENGRPVCIIGKNIQTRFFPNEPPIGKKIKAGNSWLMIVGVLEKRNASRESLENLGIRDYNDDVYIPVTTALLRFKNRATISKADIGGGNQFFGNNENQKKKDDNYHQLDRMVVRVADSKYLRSAADVTARLLKRRHHDLVDFEIEVPELLLEEQQKTQETFNFVLAAIAGISLLVGGIGIMNIMLASVLERIKEIGVRRSLGATQQDIVQQFLFEAITISLLGGIIGVILGVVAANLITSSFNIPAVVSAWSVILSFGVAASVGLVFGIFPARQAARQDPIKALRVE